MYDTSHDFLFLAKNHEKVKKDRNKPTSFFFKIFHLINILAPLEGGKKSTSQSFRPEPRVSKKVSSCTVQYVTKLNDHNGKAENAKKSISWEIFLMIQ